MPDTDSLPRLRDLLALAAVAEAGSLGAAAAALRLSQPALTQAVDRLETRLGQVLLLRRRQGSFLTEAGTRLLERHQRMQAQLRAGLAACRSAAPLRLLGDTAIATHLAVAEAGSFSAAARRRGVSLPTLARTARGLETALGVPLYRRGAEGMVPLASGLELARRFALALAEIEQGVAELAGEKGGHFRLGVLPMLPPERLARAVAAVAPGFRITTQDADYAELVARLRHGRLDALLGALRAPPPFDDLLEQPLGPDPFVVAAPAGHPLAGAAEIAPSALAKATWVVAESPLPRRATAEALFAGLPRRPPILLETNDPRLTIALLREAGALALLSRQQIAAAPGLVALPVPLSGPPRIIGLTLRREWLPTAGQARVLAALREAFGTAG